MAERPIFVSESTGQMLVREIFVKLEWHSGFAAIQKEKNVEGLHLAAATAGFTPLLEISSKSEKTVGQRLSAFHLRVQSKLHGEIPLESAFQGSKVFKHGGPFNDLYTTDARSAKRDTRLRESGELVGFDFDGVHFPLEPKTVFYDWLYINAIYPHRRWCEILYEYAGFTDIEFNPRRSISCQARSCALFLTLMRRGILDESVSSLESFVRIIRSYDYHPELRAENRLSTRAFSFEAEQI
jgi:hypothetical protein